MANVFVIGGNTDLGGDVVRVLAARGHKVTATTQGTAGAAALRAAGALPVYSDLTRARDLLSMMKLAKPEVVVNLGGQDANALTHDGLKWKAQAAVLEQGVGALLEAAQAQGVGFIVHASFAFLYGNQQHATETCPRRAPGGDPLFAAALDNEDQVIDHDIPAAVLRLGYLYGAQMPDLALYQRSFQRSRPYYAGDRHHLANFVHVEDAAEAVALAVDKRPDGESFNVTDGHPASFAAFVDHMATAAGYGTPGRLPEWWARVFMGAQQFTLLALNTSVNSDKARAELGWTPRYPDYRAGFEQVLRAWRAAVRAS